MPSRSWWPGSSTWIVIAGFLAGTAIYLIHFRAGEQQAPQPEPAFLSAPEQGSMSNP